VTTLRFSKFGELLCPPEQRSFIIPGVRRCAALIFYVHLFHDLLLLVF